MKKIKIWTFLAVIFWFSFETLSIQEVRIKNINKKSEFSLLLQAIRERGRDREVITKQDVGDVLVQLTGEILGEVDETFISEANQEILFEAVMAKMPELTLELQGRRSVMPDEILKKFNNITNQSVQLSDKGLENLLLNFNAEVFSERKGERSIAVLTGRQLFMITKDLVNNKIQNITEAIIKDRCRAIFNIELILQDEDLLVEKIKVLYGEICVLYGFLRINMLLQILQKTLNQNILYADIEAAYYDMFGVKLKYLHVSLKTWLTAVVDYKYKQHLQYHLSDDDARKMAVFFSEKEIVDYDDIQRQFLKQTKENSSGKLLSLSIGEQIRVVDLVNQEIKHKGFAEEQLVVFMDFLKTYSCSDNIISDMRNSTKYVIKSGIDRVINAQRAKRCIEQNGWKFLTIADKCFVCKKRDCAVIATRVSAQSVPVFSLSEIKELVAFTEATGYQDWGVLIKNGYSANVLRDIESGKLVFIDTEDKSFEVFFAETKYDCVELFLNVMRHLMTPDAIKWVESRLEDLKGNDEEIIILPKNSTYDPVGLNFSKVKEEAKVVLLGKYF